MNRKQINWATGLSRLKATMIASKDKYEIRIAIAMLEKAYHNYPVQAQKAAIETCKTYAKTITASDKYTRYEVAFHTLFTRFIVRSKDKKLIRSFVPVMEHMLTSKDSASFNEGLALYNAIFGFLSLFERQMIEDKLLNTQIKRTPEDEVVLSTIPDSSELISLRDNFSVFTKAAGYDKAVDFWYGLGGLPYYVKVTKACLELRDKYDIGIGIAKGGLWSSYMFRQFGLPVILVDAHKTDPGMKWLGLDGHDLTQLIQGKRVLLFDKDVVTGQTLAMVSDEISKYSPSNLDLFVLHSPGKTAGSHLEHVPSSISQTYHPDRFPIDSEALKIAKKRFANSQALDVKSIDRSRGIIERAFGKEYADAILQELYSKLDIISQLNTTDPVIADIAKNSANTLLDIELQESIEPALLKIDQHKGATIIPIDTFEGLVKRNVLTYTISLLERVASQLLHKRLDQYISKLNNVDPHRAGFYDLTSAYNVISKLIRSDDFDSIVAVGPEAFSYAYLFELAGKKVLKVHVDEYDKTQDRPYMELDDLSQIKGERVLLLEDDIVTGKTLKKVCNKLKKYSPQSFSLFLGIPEVRQNLQNIPHDIEMTYLVKGGLDEQEKTETLRSLFELIKEKPFHSGIMPFSLYL